jgi:hypothetical protein
MNLLDWRSKTWRERALLIGTLAVIVLLTSHPELRLFVPLVDALGIDLFLILLGSQVWDYARPAMMLSYHSLVLPIARKVYSLMLFFCGCLAP